MIHPQIILNLNNSQATHQLGWQLGKLLPAGSVILLQGELGAGKTTLVQGLGRGLEIAETIVSPTFTLVNEYLTGRLPLYHLDLYRLGTTEVSSIYPEIYWEGVEVQPGIVAIEWSEYLPFRPQKYLHIKLIHKQQETRTAELELFGMENLPSWFNHLHQSLTI